MDRDSDHHGAIRRNWAGTASGTSTGGPVKLGNLAAMVRAARTLDGHTPPTAVHKRQMVARFCKMLAAEAGIAMPGPCEDPRLSPRERQTLHRLLAGDSEKEVAAQLGVSPHTVHIYVKSLYKYYQVSSRGELMAKCLPERNR
jgi:DNA-binding CsgD family transcriptional regulator